MSAGDILDFADRVAVVTGAGAGLGRAHAMLLAERGARVVVADLPPADGGESTAARVVREITSAGGEAVAAEASVADSVGGAAIVQRAIAAFGRVDIVINNAGIVRDRSFAKLSDEEIDAVLRVHLLGAFNVTRPAWPYMREQGYGRILCTASNAGILGNFGQANYAAAKTGLVGLTRVLAIEGHRYGICANLIAPMGRTQMTEGVAWPVFDALEPEHVSPAVVWLVHEECTVSGETYSVAGGQVARFFTGRTQGIYSARLTPEEIRQRFSEIRSTEGFLELGSATEEIELLASRLGSVSHD
jgi:NAD(P)-dependent dehydrogenase (short-subunit alcohol dehydrogenase family)